MRYRLLLLSLGWCVAVLADNYPRQPGIDVHHYIFRITLQDESDEISGETTVAVRFVKDGVSEVALDLASAAGGKGMTVTDVAVDQGTIRYAHQANRLTITLAAAPKAG